MRLRRVIGKLLASRTPLMYRFRFSTRVCAPQEDKSLSKRVSCVETRVGTTLLRSLRNVWHTHCTWTTASCKQATGGQYPGSTRTRLSGKIKQTRIQYFMIYSNWQVNENCLHSTLVSNGLQLLTDFD